MFRCSVGWFSWFTWLVHLAGSPASPGWFSWFTWLVLLVHLVGSPGSPGWFTWFTWLVLLHHLAVSPGSPEWLPWLSLLVDSAECFSRLVLLVHLASVPKLKVFSFVSLLDASPGCLTWPHLDASSGCQFSRLLQLMVAHTRALPTLLVPRTLCL